MVHDSLPVGTPWRLLRFDAMLEILQAGVHSVANRLGDDRTNSVYGIWHFTKNRSAESECVQSRLTTVRQWSGPLRQTVL